MALELNYELPSGVSGDYWKIDMISMDRVRPLVSVQIMLYKDEQARADGKLPMMNKVYHFQEGECADFESPAQDEEDVNLIKTAYEKIKAHQDEFFAEAQDV